MPHEISQGPHPNLILLRLYGDLMPDDIDIDAELGLGSGKPLYLMLDVSEMSTGVPENFMDAARHSAYSHPDVKHTAVFLRPGPIALLARVVPKLTRQQGKLSTYTIYDEGLAHLKMLIQQAGL